MLLFQRKLGLPTGTQERRTFEGMNFQFRERKKQMFQFREHLFDSEKERICKFGTI